MHEVTFVNIPRGHQCVTQEIELMFNVTQFFPKMVVESYGAIGHDEEENVFGEYKEESSRTEAKKFNFTKLLGNTLPI